MRWVVLSVMLAAAVVHAEPQRWALLIGENRGLLGEEPLKFAEHDARRVAQTLEELAEVPSANSVVVAGADAVVLRDALAQLEARMRQSGERHDRLIVYVSSHAGDGELHLRNTTLPLSEIVEFLKRVPVNIGILVVDACRSGAMTGTKGLKPTTESVWTSEVAPLEGRILISASGADEYAQESDALSGSYFTHHLVTGLRGAADSSGDGRVTLDEAYRWAWARTVESTFSTKGGVQRPHFKVDLRGQGELVLTELRSARSQITLDVDAPGQWMLVDSATGTVAAHIEKPKGPLALAMAPGSYRVRSRIQSGYLEKDVRLEAGEHLVLRESDFEAGSFVRVALKGRDTSLYVLSAAGSFSSPVVGGVGGSPGLDARLRLERDWFDPVNQLSFQLSARDVTSSTIGFRHTELELRGGIGRHWDWSRVVVAISTEAGAMTVLQGALPDGSSRTSLAPLVALVGEVRVHLLGPVDLLLGGQGGAAFLKKTQGTSLVSRFSAAAGVAVAF